MAWILGLVAGAALGVAFGLIVDAAVDRRWK